MYRFIAAGNRPFTYGGVLLYVLPAALLLSAAALYNGYPLAFPDSGDYIHTRNTPMRAPFYVLLTKPIQYTGSTWPFVILHALLTAHLLYLLTRTRDSGVGVVPFLVVVSLVVLLTSASWYVSFLMPDIFAAIAILSLYLFLLRADRLSSLEQAWLLALILVACLVHLSNAPTILGLCVLAALLARRLKISWARIGAAAAVLFAAVLTSVGYTWSTARVLAPTPAGYVHLLAALVRTGQLKTYLDESCPTTSYRICPYRDSLPDKGDEFLWNRDSPLHKVGSFTGYRDEGTQLIGATMASQPLATTVNWIETTLEQLTLFDTARNSFTPMARLEWPTRHFEVVYPREMDQYRGSRQNQSRLPFPRLGEWHRAFVILCLAVGLVLCAVRWRRVKNPFTDPVIVMIGFFLAAMIMTAAATGFPSGEPTNRYMARVIWILPLAVLLALIVPGSGTTSARPGSGGE